MAVPPLPVPQELRKVESRPEVLLSCVRCITITKIQSAGELPSRAVLMWEPLSDHFDEKVFFPSMLRWGLAGTLEPAALCSLNVRYTCLSSGAPRSPWSPGTALEGRNSPTLRSYAKNGLWLPRAWTSKLVKYRREHCDRLFQRLYVCIHTYTHIHVSSTCSFYKWFFLKGLCSGLVSLERNLWKVQLTVMLYDFWEFIFCDCVYNSLSLSLSAYTLGHLAFRVKSSIQLLQSQHAGTSRMLALEMQIPRKPCLYQPSEFQVSKP